MPIFKIAVTVAAVAAYVGVSHAALVIEDAFSLWRQLAVVLLIVPLAGFACWSAVMALRKAGLGLPVQVLAGLGVAVGATWLAIDSWHMLLTQLDWIYLMQHIGANTMLCWFFAQTLFGGRVPAITMIARTIHPDMPESMVRYTRSVTVAWSAFFALQVLVSLAIFAFFSIETWSLFANVLNWPMVILMFAGEYLCRKRCNPDFRHASIRESVAAYLNSKDKI